VPGSLPLKNDVQLVTQLPQSQRQVHDVLSAAKFVPPISDSEVTCGPMTRLATLSSSATSSSNSTDFSSSSRTIVTDFVTVHRHNALKIILVVLLIIKLNSVRLIYGTSLFTTKWLINTYETKAINVNVRTQQ